VASKAVRCAFITSGPESGQSSYYRHPAALVESDDIGAGTRIWAFVHILPGVSIGSGCNIGDHCFVEGGVHIGNDVVLKNGVAVGRRNH
jgi:UDP-2-acetamido-3-amino-2,3-dideoxy-glucuronate N-acetyltransferase